MRALPPFALTLALLLTLTSLGPGPSLETAPRVAPTPAVANPPSEAEPLERRPYQIRAWIGVEPGTRIDPKGRAALIASWRALVGRFVGLPWDLEVADGDGPVPGAALDALSADAIAPEAVGYDKAWIIRIGPGRDDGFDLSGREFDTLTGRLGPPRRRAAPNPADAPRVLLDLTLALFEPIAEIGETFGKGANLTVQGSALPSAHPIGQVAPVGTVFRPYRIYQKPDGSVLRIDLIRLSYLRVDAWDGPSAKTTVYSAYAAPLTRKVVQRHRLVAVGMKPVLAPTRLRFLTSGQEKYPAAGYTLRYRHVPDGNEREIATTDRDGRVVLEPGFADRLVIFRLLAGNIEPLVEFPFMPGEDTEEQTILIRPMNEAVALETEVNAIRDQVIDLVAHRKRLEALLKARAEGEAWDEVEALLAEYRKLTPKSALAERLAQLKDDARRQQKPGKPILTRAAQALCAEVEATINGYLDDDVFQAYADALREARAGAAKAAAKKAANKAALKALTKPNAATTAPPP
ncbi:MAG: hypothetical protein IRY99_15035, partial [Isosphaeraceae bacterium]|nr:hypothetical protein [Isosphaeraceae bacterium]